MGTYRVIPLPDGTSQAYGWQVKKGGRRVSKHYKKSGAERKAKSVASEDDRIVVHRADGTVQTSISG